ncbi:MAG: sigma-70 family RNA polymerase sigma factor, partial [Acidimicrobiales bacterium]|nr:sigma-70 family RNA polymerase sigma factor [Acidimicrobiales bacterium]
MTDDHHLDLDELERVEAVVTRVVRARVRTVPEAEDLVQETLTRFLAERERGDIRDPEHYAATIALNLIRARWRHLAREGEVLPLLVDLREPTEPVDLAVESEVSAALSAALDELDDERRRLLVEHELAGRSATELAETSTPAAIAASLARTRARLRVDVVVRYRRAELPTVACRPVLESLSANDARRQGRLGAAEHVETCETCAELADVIGRRGTAWLGLAPLASLFRRPSVQAGSAAVVVAAVVAIAASV